MNDTRLKVKLFHKDLDSALKDLAAKHGLTLDKSHIKFDEYQYKVALAFAVAARKAELKKLEAELYAGEGDPKIGQEVAYKGTTYTITGYNRASNLLAERKVDKKSFIFKRNRINGKFDYFDGMTNERVRPTVHFDNLPVTTVGIRTQENILEDLRGVENGLSPENLSCDGELPAYRVNQRRAELNRQKKALITELGRVPTDAELYPEIYGEKK